MVRDLRGYETVKTCPPNDGFMPETKTVVQKVRALRSFICVKNHPCKVPIVTLTDYQVVGISVDISEEDSHVTLLDGKGNIKDDLKLPTDQNLLSQIKFGFAEGKDVSVTVASALGKEKIIASKILKPK